MSSRLSPETDSYITVRNEASDEIVIQKSRFIGYAAPCETEEEALSFLRRIKEKHRDARHHCYAYVVGLNAGIMRYSDDGEPGGTAGKPCLDVLLGEDVSNVLVIVIRYFGGTLLGTGGLVRAYTKGAQIALAAAGVIEKKVYVRSSIRMDYGYLSKIQYLIGKKPAEEVGVVDTVYEDNVIIRLLVREDIHDRFRDEITASSEGRLALEDEEKVLAAPVSGKLQVFKE